MNIRFSKEISDNIINTWGCKDVTSETEVDGFDSIYFCPMVYIQTPKNRGTETFDEKHLSELPKEDLLEILSYMIINHFKQ